MVYRKVSIGILDYDCGNVNSLCSIIKSLGFNAFISKDKFALQNSDLMILPGVGNFFFAMQKLRQIKMTKFIKSYSKKKPIIGICLGMQLLFSSGSETKKTKGLDIIKGQIKKFNNHKCKIGWDKCINKNSLTKNLVKNSEYYYFNHSFFASTSQKHILSYAYYGREKYPAIVKKNNLIGFQFHPEKSQFSGKKLLKKAINLLLND